MQAIANTNVFLFLCLFITQNLNVCNLSTWRFFDQTENSPLDILWSTFSEGKPTNTDRASCLWLNWIELDPKGQIKDIRSFKGTNGCTFWQQDNKLF